MIQKCGFAIAMIAATMTLGCGSGSGDGPSGLSAAQKTRLNGTLDSVGRAQSAVQSAQPRGRGARDDGDEVSAMASRLRAGCEIDVKMPSELNQSPPTNGTTIHSEFWMNASGADCPISMEARFSLIGSETELTAAVDQRYLVLDERYLPLNDVSAMELKGEATFRQDAGGIRGTIDMRGMIRSQRDGEIRVTVAGTVSGDDRSARGVTELAFVYPDLKVVFKQTLSAQRGGQTSEKYFLNDAEISKEEFRAYLERGGPMFAFVN